VRSFLLANGEAGPWDSDGQPLVRVNWSGGSGNESGGESGNDGGTTAPTTRDVAVTGLSVPTSLTTGSSATIKVTVRNEGTTSESVTVTLNANGAAIGSPRSVSLAAGSSKTVNFSWRPTAAGTYTLEARAEINGEDSDPSDNSRTATVTLTQSVRDVAITNLTGPTQLRRGQNGTVSVTLENRGTASVTVTVTLTTQPRNAAMGTVRSKVTLSPGATRTISFTWRTNSRTALGTYTVTASAPLSGDANPADNTRSVTITVTSR